ncbi:MAG: hypothetical protein GY803_25660 [Chloroflexi bacterium]|nr:hypothetical protein [Chloroflexota bacterium]
MMTEQKQEWDYCRIEIQLRHKGEDDSRSGVKQVWLAFIARASGPHQRYLAGDVEIPLANVIGAPFTAQKSNIGHVNIHQNLLLKLQVDGWELLPGKGGDWWEKRLRRPARPKKSLWDWMKRN